MAMTTTLPGWTASHGINATTDSATLVMAVNSQVAHIAANTGWTHTNVWTDREAVTACDRVLTAWWRPGLYDRSEIDYVLTVDPYPTFRSLCKSCLRVAAANGIDLTPKGA